MWSQFFIYFFWVTNKLLLIISKALELGRFLKTFTISGLSTQKCESQTEATDSLWSTEVCNF